MRRFIKPHYKKLCGDEAENRSVGIIILLKLGNYLFTIIKNKTRNNKMTLFRNGKIALFLILFLFGEIGLLRNILFAQIAFPEKKLELFLRELDSPYLKRRNEAEDWLVDHYSLLEEKGNYSKEMVYESLSNETRHRLDLIKKRWKNRLIAKTLNDFSGKIIQFVPKDILTKSKNQKNRSFEIFNVKILIDLPSNEEIIRLSFDPSTFCLRDQNGSFWTSASSSSMQESEVNLDSRQSELTVNIKKNNKNTETKTNINANTQNNLDIKNNSDNGINNQGISDLGSEKTLNFEKRNLEQFIRSELTCSATVALFEREFRFDNLSERIENSEKNSIKMGETTVSILQFKKKNDQWTISLSIQFENAYDSLESFRGWILKRKMELILTDRNNNSIQFSPQKVRQRFRTADSVALDISFPVDNIQNLSQQSISFRCFVPSYLFKESFIIKLKNDSQIPEKNR
ncbi:MAG: hypothetical protein Q4C95_03430 [Planctomycetia bacterium]|nr:hypothetical protein [Planctomycetia bacterium]